MINEIFEKEILNQPDDMKATIKFIRNSYEVMRNQKKL